MDSLSYPDFADPPVVETILGVEFTPLESWRIPHFGLFWEAIKSDFPEVEDQLPLVSQIEKFEKPSKPTFLKLPLTGAPQVRCWFVNPERSMLLQLQNGRFIENWRKITGSENYHHYEGSRASFERDWQRFLHFLEKARLPAPVLQQCEVAYINHLEIGKGWSSLAELEKVSPALACLKREPLPVPEAFLLNVRYLLPDRRGRLHVQLQHGLRDSDGKEILVFSLTARGVPASSDVDEVLGWFDFGRGWIHRAFDTFTTQSMRELWGRKDET
jgi:uncharacterized protein (TIGR04255 family)